MISSQSPTENVRIDDLIERYLIFCSVYYGDAKRGTTANIIDSVRELQSRFGKMDASNFRPRDLKSVRETMIEIGLSRTTINYRVLKIKAMFRWAVSEEFVDVDVLQRLQTVDGLKRGRTTANEPERRQPVAWDDVNATLPFVPEVVADMICFQWHTAARSGSVVTATANQFEVDPQNADLMLWRPRHKTEHLGTELIIPIGPKCQRVLRPYLGGGPLFDPSRDPMARGNVGKVYSPASYRRAIVRGIEKASRQGVRIPKWSPHAIRHARGHEIRRTHGIEAVQAILGHASLSASEIYSERRLNTAREIAAAIG